MAERTCSVEDCDGKHYGKGFCHKHWKRWRKTGTTDARLRPQTCSVDGCDGLVNCRGWCKKHYSRWQKHGTTADPPPRKNALDAEGLRLCFSCEERLPPTAFYARGDESRCRTCMKRVSTERYRANRERIVANLRARRAANPEKFRQQKRESIARTHEAVLARQRAWWAARGAELAAEQRRTDPRKRKNVHLKTRYGITIEQYDEMCERQGGACAICHETPPVLYVDHCHDTGAVRGLLCSTCNSAMGQLRDDPLLAYRAAFYLAGMISADGLVWEESAINDSSAAS